MPIGLEIVGGRVLALAVDDEGHVEGRVEAQQSADLAGVAREMVRQVAGPSPSVVGVAALVPDAPELTAALAALRNDGLALAGSVLPSGAAAAAAESWVGAARGWSSVAFFAVGEHTTGGLVRDGAPIGGAHGRAGSVAWLALNPVDREDYRKVGCLETECAAAGIVRRLVWRIKTGDRCSIQDIVGDDFAAITLDHVLGAARGGDGVAISIVRETAKYLGMAAANLVVIADPEILVVGGIMASASDILLDPLRAEVQRRLPRAMSDALVIAPAELGDDAAAIGAARLAAHALQ